jgi:hypothetical protein
VFATTTVAQPKLAAALMGTLIKGLGADRVVWGSDAVWTGAPQWQIEGLRRLEIHEDMQAKYGFAPLGPATGPVKSAIFGETAARLYGIEPTSYASAGDRLAQLKAAHRKTGGGPSNLRYGYVARG